VNPGFARIYLPTVDTLLYLFAFLALIAVLTFATMVWTVIGIRLKRGTCDEAGREEFPQYLGMLFEDQQKRLSSLGFQHSHYQRYDLPFVNDYSVKYAAVMVQSEQRTYAVIIPSDLPEPGGVCNLEFLTLFTDGTRLITMNNILHRLVGKFPDSLIYDPYAETPEIQWSAHLKNLAEHASKERAEVLPPAEFVANIKGFIDKYIDGLESRKDITKEAEGGSYRINMPFALSLTWKMMAGESKSAELRKRMHKPGNLNPYEVPPDLEVESFNRMAYSYSHRKNMGWLGKFLLLAVTIVLFAFSFGYLKRIEGLIIIIAVLLFHELGHMAGMYLFRYKDVKILFLPFLGAATMGSRRDAKPHEKVIISFLGPTPGIIAGMMIFLFFPSATGYMKETAIMLLILNYLNLLPIMPLDGGQVFNVFMARFPYLQTIFQSASALLLAIVFGMAFNNGFFTFLGFFLFFGAISSMPVCALQGRLRERAKRFGESISDEELLREIFILLKDRPFSTAPFARKFQVAKSISESYSAVMPSIWLIAGGIVFYVALFAVPLLLYILSLVIRNIR
jgi:Zn-dependent protease